MTQSRLFPSISTVGEDTLRPPTMEIHSEVSNVLRKAKTSITGGGGGDSSRGTQSPTTKSLRGNLDGNSLLI